MSKKEKWEELYEEYKAGSILTREELDGRWDSQNQEYRKRLSEVSDSSSEEYKQLKSEWKKLKAKYEEDCRKIEKYKGVAKNEAKIEKAKIERDAYQSLLDELLDTRKENEAIIERRKVLAKEAAKLEEELEELKYAENHLRMALKDSSLSPDDRERVSERLSDNMNKQAENQHAFSENQLALQKELEVTITPIDEAEIEMLEEGVKKFNTICEMLAEGKTMGEITSVLSEQKRVVERKEAEADILSDDEEAKAKARIKQKVSTTVRDDGDKDTAASADITIEDSSARGEEDKGIASDDIAEIFRFPSDKRTAGTTIEDSSARGTEDKGVASDDIAEIFRFPSDKRTAGITIEDSSARGTEATGATQSKTTDSAKGTTVLKKEKKVKDEKEITYISRYPKKGIEIEGRIDDSSEDEILFTQEKLRKKLDNPDIKETLANTVRLCMDTIDSTITEEDFVKKGIDLDIVYSLASLGKIKELKLYIKAIYDKEQEHTLPFHICYDMRGIYNSGLSLNNVREFQRIAEVAEENMTTVTIEKDNILKRFFGNIKLRFSEWKGNLNLKSGSSGEKLSLNGGERKVQEQGEKTLREKIAAHIDENKAIKAIKEKAAKATEKDKSNSKVK